ncbi:response regulator [Desulfogranum marinum]|uniref:response regulator n=1 Tax=Desulfogranum marinum TaxID=453220 RepID=UPI00196651C1|nr:response regulator [Desulfogranum marinum]MBM9513329.1 response regulator [Desulfogranum marinum]
MSAIAMSYSVFTQEKEIREQLAAVSGYEVVQDADIISEVCSRYKFGREKVERAVYGPPSAFNRFTHERETMRAYLKLVMAEHMGKQGVLFSGFVTHLVPPAATHILKVGLFDEKTNRIHRAVKEGVSEKNASKLIKKNDNSISDWVNFLHGKPASDHSLYDIFIPVGSKTPAEAVQLIMENYRKPAVMETDESLQAVADMATGARVELALLSKGYTTEVQCSNAKVVLRVNKSVHSFSKLTETLSSIAGQVEGVRQVEVVAGKDYHVSIYRDQEFTLPPKVLLVDDEQEFVQTLSDRLNTRSYGSYPLFDGEQAMEFLTHETPDVMVLDLKMPGMQGVEVLKKTKEAKPEIEVIILTGHGSEEDKKICLELGAYAYLQKPVDIVQLTAIIDEAYKEVAAAKMAQA